MEDITEQFTEVYQPVKALLVYELQSESRDAANVYVEAYDIDGQGKPVNAHPLEAAECIALSKSLAVAETGDEHYLNPRCLLPANVLSLRNGFQGQVVWYTPPQEVPLFFKEALAIPSGKAHVPALIWKASKEELYLYAVRPPKKKPCPATQLYHAPFFNIHDSGSVCMGDVDLCFAQCRCLEDFISQWEVYFFNSYFSHLIGGQARIKGNIVQLWQQQVKSGQPFPDEILVQHSHKLKDLIP